MRNINGLVLMLIFGLFSCKSTSENKEVSAEKSIQKKNATEKNNELNSDCPRGIAKPVVKKVVFPQTTFELQGDSLSGLETVTFDDGDILIIKNWGCEYYVLTFRFETSHFEADTANLRFWYKKTAILLSQVDKGLNAPIEIKKGIVKLHNYISSNNEKLKLGEEIDFSVNEIQNTLTIDRVEKLKNKKIGVEVSFRTGPL